MRVAIDTNDLLRMAAGGDQSRLARHWRDRRFELLMSLSTLTELRTVLARTELQKFVPASTGELFVGLIEQRAVFVQPDLSAPQCRWRITL